MKKIQFLLILLTTLWTVQGQSGYDYAVPYGSDSLYFKAVSEGVKVVNYDNSYNSKHPIKGMLEIPDTIVVSGTKYVVVEVGDYAFSQCLKITSVELPNTILRIGTSAFAMCTALKKVRFPSKLTSMGNGAFNSCSKLDTLVLPDTITSWGSGTFAGCTRLCDIHMPKSTASIPVETFKGCEQLDNVYVGGSIKEIKENAFAYCTSLEHVTFGDELEYIRNNAFRGCNLDSIYIPASVNSIGTKAFFGCQNLKSIVVDDNNLHYDSRDGCNAVINSSDDMLILGCENTTIPDGVLAIGDDALMGCYHTTSELIIPNSVVKIGRNSLSWNSLKKVQLPSGLKHLENAVFFENIYLQNVVMPDSLLTIGDSVFTDNISLDSIDLPESVYEVGCAAFANCTSMKKVNVKGNIKDIERYAFYACHAMSTFSLGDSIASVGKEAFRGCDNWKLSKLVLPETLEFIGSDAFNSCKKIDTFYICRKAPAYIQGDPGFSSSQVILLPCGTFDDYISQWAEALEAKNIVEMPSAPFEVTVNVDNSQHGVAEVVPQGFNDVGCDSSAIVMATADDGWLFHHWSTGSLQNPDTIRLTRDSTVTAYFVQDVTPTICKVSVEQGRNVVSWTQDNEVSAFYILRHNPTSNSMEYIDSFSVDAFSGYKRWEDIQTDPSTGSMSYAVQARDVYGVMSSASGLHSTVHLTVKKEENGSHTLCWNGYGGYFTGGYSIYRGSTPGNMQSVTYFAAKDIEMAEYTYTVDSLNIDLPVYYQIKVEMQYRCTPGEAEEYSCSNVVCYSGVGIFDAESTDYNVTVSVVEGCIHVRGGEGRRAAVYDMMGRQVATEVPTAPLPRGVYLVRVEGLPAVKAVVMR